MTITLLTTKFNIPKLRPGLVKRPRLIEKFNAGLNGRLTLVSAPAGFGKTTLVADWLSQLPISSHSWKYEQCTWISLDKNDNEPVRFFQYLITAIHLVYPNLGVEQLEIIENSPKPNFQTITRDLINKIAVHIQPLLIILDDYHEIHNVTIHQIIQTIVDYLPSNLHLVITSRQDPPLALPRWRVRSWLSDIRDTDLRFDQEESEKFLHQTMRLDLNSKAVALLEERTEGWVAGLQLAALSLMDTEFSPELIQQFGGQDRYIAEYLLTEVLDHQPEEIQQFLLPTAVFDRFNTELCIAVLHPDSSPEDINLTQSYQKLIETLERANLFIISLDRKGYWYRYHHLFAQLLRQRLEQRWSPNEIQKIYNLAAHWFADNDFIEESIQLAIKGENYAFAAQLITNFHLDDLWYQTWGLQLRKWGAQIPDEILLEYPQAALLVALAHMTRNEVKESIPYIDLVREDSRVNAEILLIDSIFIRNKGDFLQALSLANEAALHFESQNETLYIAAKTQVIVCLMALGEMVAAEDLAKSLLHEIHIKSEGYSNVYVQLIQTLGFIQEQRGKLVEAERVYLEGLDLVKNLNITLPLIGLLQVRLGAIYYQWNDIEQATECCETGLAWGERTGIGDILTHGLFVLVDLAILRQDVTATKTILKQMSKLLDWPEFNVLDSVIRANQASFDVRLGNLASAIRWADSTGFTLNDIPIFRQRVEYLNLARVRLEEIRHLGLGDQAPKVLKLVDRLIDTLSKHGIVDTRIYCWSLKALLYDLNGQTKNAIEALHKALDMAFAGGFIRIFLDLGTPMRDLLQKSLTHKPHMVYKRRLLMEFSNENVTPTASVSGRSIKQDITITLTPREFEILGLIAAGLSNKAIQERLLLSKNTVRTHIKNLYSKLGVHSRTKAIQQAREIGLI